MNDFSELESELKRLRPTEVGDALFQRIERALLRPNETATAETATAETPSAGIIPRQPSRTGTWWSLGLGLTAATVLILLGLGFFAPPQTKTTPTLAQATLSASVLLGLGFLAQPQTEPTVAQNPTPPSASLTSGFRPATLSQVVYRQRDEGLFFSPNQSERLLRRVRYDTRETMQWRNPRTGASLRVSYPAEQVVLTPVSFQ